MVVCFVSVFALSLVVSADFGSTNIGVLLDNALESAFNSGDYGFLFGFYDSQVSQSLDQLSPEERAAVYSSYYKVMKDSDEFDPSSTQSSWASDLQSIEIYCQLAVSRFGAPALSPGEYHYMIWAIRMSNYYLINVRVIYDTSHYNNWNYYLSRYNEPCVKRGDNAKLACVYAQIIDKTMFGGSQCSVENGLYDPARDGCYTNQDMSASNVYCYATDMVESPLRFASDFSAPSHKQYNITLNSNKPVPDDFIAVFGVLYNDGTHVYDGTDCGYLSCDFIGSATLRGGQEWEWHFNQQEFSKWAYRKRIFDTDCFYAFVHVFDGNEIIYADSRKLNLYAPTDIFADTQELPDYSDYVNTPISLPNLLPTTFNYSPTTYQTVQDYNGTDFDFASFFGWYEDAFAVMANNMNAFFANAQAFFGAFADFSINGIVNAIGNLGSLIDDLNFNLTSNVNNLGDFLDNLGKSLDFNNKMLIDNLDTDIKNSFGVFSNTIGGLDLSLGNYFDDLSSTIISNIDTINDNLDNLLDVALVPDRVYLDFVLSDCLPWYHQLRDCLTGHNFDSDSLSLSVDFGDVLGSYTFTYDDAATAGRIRSIVEIILLAGTALGCGRLGFQILGIDISAGKGGY